jgi:hypothetical protein
MLHIILLILKIIGMVLLVLIGLLLLLLLTILLVPVRYRIKAAHGEDLFRVEGTISWLLHVIHARISMKNDKPHILVRIFGIKIFDSLSIKRPKARNKAKPDKKYMAAKSSLQKKKDSNKFIDQKQNDPNRRAKTIEEAKDRNLSESSTEKLYALNKNEPHLNDGNADDIPIREVVLKDLKVRENDTNDRSINGQSSDTKDKQTLLRRFLNKLRNIKEKIISFFRTVKERIKNWIKVSFNIKHKIHLVSAFFKDEGNRDGFRLTFHSVKKLLKHVLPTKLKSTIIFGTGDPCSTGQALGALSILYSFYGDKIQITPDFENKRLEGKHYARGRIRLVTILIIVIKLLDKRFKQLKSNMKTLKEAL